MPKVTNIIIYCANKSNNYNIYHPVNKYFKVEEIKQSIMFLKTKIKSIKTFYTLKTYKNSFFGYFNIKKAVKIKTKNIKLDKNIKILNSQKNLGTIILSGIQIKIIIKFELKKIFLNSIKRINFL